MRALVSHLTSTDERRCAEAGASRAVRPPIEIGVCHPKPAKAGSIPMRVWMMLALCAAVFFALAQGARAQTPDPYDRVYNIAKQLNCPTCGGRNLADCPTDTCTQWKNEIKVQLDSGKTQQQVIQYFLDRFGPTVLQEPPKQGAILALWVIPILALIALAAAAIVVVRRSTVAKSAAQPSGATTPVTRPADPYAAELEEEVRKAS
jgi:cytochrome c-type biogenesis protein CcmH